MNNQSPLVPQGSVLEQKNKGRTRVKIAVFFVLTIHGIGLMALLLQGCRRDDPKGEQAATSSALPTIESQAQVADATTTSNTGPAVTSLTPGATPGTGTETPALGQSTIGG